MSTHISSTASSVTINKDYEAFSILEFLPRKSGETKVSDPSFIPKIVQRLHDGEVFQIGDEVTNGLVSNNHQCIGKITGFSYLEGKIFVENTWSGVGWNLGSVRRIEKKLSSLWQIGDQVLVQFPGSGEINNAKVIKVAFTKNDILYDVEVPYRSYDDENIMGLTNFARIHGLREWHLRQRHNDLIGK